jgi:hypothetical protein
MTRGIAFSVMVAVVAVLGYLGISTAESRCQSQQNTYRAETAAQNAGRNVTEFAFDRGWLPCLAERVTADPQPRDASEKEKRDLAAQEAVAGMAFWVGVIALLQLVATVWGLLYIRGTLRATLQAVEDTSEATEAMRETNRIAKIAQRPWLKIEVEIEKASFEDELLSLRYVAKITNVGKMVADRCAARGSFIERDDLEQGQATIAKVRAEVEKIASITDDGSIMPYPVLPGETNTIRGALEHSGDFKAFKKSSKTNVAWWIIFISARYHIPGETIMRQTDRAFRFDYIRDDDGDDLFSEGFGIPLPIPPDFGTERVRLRSAGHNRTT